ncbi:hypothetical protein V6N13_047378 [Hibiscus sabdariffa]
MLSLLLSSEPHRNTLLKLLNQTFVPKEISIDMVDRLVGNIAMDNFISFSDEEIPKGARGSYKALHITTRCKGYTLLGVLIDNGSALNVLPMTTMKKLPIDSTHMKAYQNTVRAFDGTQRDVLGKITVPLLVGPAEYEVDFVVMDIKPTYSCLLGRPWIHAAGAVPSTLHQKLKFVIDGKLVTVRGEEDIIASIATNTPYIEMDEDAVECSFRSLELVSATFVEENKVFRRPKLSRCAKMQVKQTLGRGAQIGRGFGKQLHGRLYPICIKGKTDRFGLGYQPDRRQRKAAIAKNEERRRARLTREDLPWDQMEFPPIGQSFVSGGLWDPKQTVKGDVPGYNPGQYRDFSKTINGSKNGLLGFTDEDLSSGFVNLTINAVIEGDGEIPYLGQVGPCPPGFELNNWTAEELPVIFKTNTGFLDVNGVSSIIPDSQVDFGQNPSSEEFTNCEDDEGCDLPDDLRRMMECEEKQILPHKEELETLNLGTEEERREVKIGTTISADTRQNLIKLLQKYIDVFAWSYQDMPGLDEGIAMHRLPIRPECKPVQQKLRRMKPEMLLKIQEEVKKQFEAGFLQAVTYSDWVANIVPVPKKDGKVRMCVDYRDLNKASPKDNFPLPHIDTLVDNTAGHSYFSFMDGFSGYNQIKMCPDDMNKTTFVTWWGTFCYKVMPFGLKNAGATYQRAMVALFHDMMHKEIEVYVDDMIAKSKTEKEHLTNLERLFWRLREFRLKLNPAKCTFGVTSGKLLGFIVSRKGIEIDPDKVRAIQELPPPRTQKEVRGFLGRLNYISRFISQLTDRCDPIYRLLRKNNPGEWNDECQTALERIKKQLTNAPILVSPVPDRSLILYLTVFENSMGCVLGQHDDSGKKERAIYYLSKKFTEYEAKYSPVEKLCCALVWATKRLRQYMLYHTTWLISRLDPLEYMMEAPALSGRLARWQMLLSEFDILYVSRKAVKGSAIADFLASRVSDDYESLDYNFPDEDLLNISHLEESNTKKSWVLYFDGASNFLGRGIGAMLISPEGDYYPLAGRLEFFCTNNMTEYEACAMGLRAAIDRKIKTLEVFRDSSVVVRQIKGEWETRDPKLIEYQKLILELAKEFEEITFAYLPREDNRIADALATLATLFKAGSRAEMMPIQMKILENPAHCCEIQEEADGNPWYYDILRYIKFQEYPSCATENDKRIIRKMSVGYVLDGEVLYKRGSDQVLMRCVNAKEAQQIIEEVHEGICGTHPNGFTMARHIMRYMQTSYILPPQPLHVMTSPWPFSTWGMDVIGPIFSRASNGHRFIFVIIDYFTKWVEAASFASVTESVICRFIKKEIICRFGLPERIVSDNAKNLNSKMMERICERFKIKHHRSVTYRPKMNGAVEAANKNIKRIVAKMTTTYRDWHEKLPFALLAYRTSVRTSTGATPYSLVYGTEAVLPIEVEIPSLRILLEVKLDEAEWVQARYDQLNLIEEKRLKAICHAQMYQKRMIRAHNKKVRPREFREGDLVLKMILPIEKDSRGKWMPNWKGPYVVTKAFSGGALILAEIDGEELQNPVNSDSVKRYHA